MTAGVCACARAAVVVFVLSSELGGSRFTRKNPTQNTNHLQEACWWSGEEAEQGRGSRQGAAPPLPTIQPAPSRSSFKAADGPQSSSPHYMIFLHCR